MHSRLTLAVFPEFVMRLEDKVTWGNRAGVEGTGPAAN